MALDLTKLSDEDLFALKDGDLTKMSDQGLQMLQQASQPKPTRGVGEELARQVGLTARAGATGVASLPLALGDALNTLINMGIKGVGGSYQLPMASKSGQALLTKAGLPTPETATERVVQDVASSMAGVGGTAKLAEKATEKAILNAPQVTKFLTENIGGQLASAGGSSLLSGSAREAGGGEGAQLGFGLLGAILPQVGTQIVQSGVRAGKEAVRPFTTEGRDIIAGKVLTQLADDPALAMAKLESYKANIPGYTPTTAQASRDVGLVSAEQGIKALDVGGQFAKQASAANQARLSILDKMAKDKDAVTNLIAKREEITAPLREAAFSKSTETPQQIQSAISLVVNKQIDDILASDAGKRGTVQKAMEYAKGTVNRADNVGSLYEVRKDLRAAAQGLLDREGSAYSQAKAQLEKVIKSVDDVIDSSAPGYKDYLKTYSNVSKQIERMEELQGIKAKVTSTIPDPINVGDFMLSQASFAKAVRSIPKDTAIPKGQIALLNKISKDLDEGVLGRATKPAGSDTFKNISTANLIGGIIGKESFGAVSPAMNKLVSPLNWLFNGTDDQIRELLVDAMVDPKVARRLLGQASQNTVVPLSEELKKKALNLGYGAAFGLTGE